MYNGSDTKIIRSNRRSLSLQVLPNSTLVIKAPLFLSQQEINKFIKHHENWIEKKILSLQKVKIHPKLYQKGESFLYLGKAYLLTVGNYKEIEFGGDQLLFPSFLHFRIKKELDNWYITQAKKIISEQVEYYSQLIGTNYKNLTFSDTHSKWGSCTHDNRLQFCWRLIMAPILVINYVVIHELVHTIEKNHSRSFWSKVRLYNPSCKQQIKWLKENTTKLLT